MYVQIILIFHSIVTPLLICLCSYYVSHEKLCFSCGITSIIYSFVLFFSFSFFIIKCLNNVRFILYCSPKEERASSVLVTSSDSSSYWRNSTSPLMKSWPKTNVSVSFRCVTWKCPNFKTSSSYPRLRKKSPGMHLWLVTHRCQIQVTENVLSVLLTCI